MLQWSLLLLPQMSQVFLLMQSSLMTSPKPSCVLYASTKALPDLQALLKLLGSDQASIQACSKVLFQYLHYGQCRNPHLSLLPLA